MLYEISNTLKCKSVQISTKTYYKITNPSDTDDAKKSSPAQLLTDFEKKNKLLKKLVMPKKICKCLRGKDVKEIAQKLYSDLKGLKWAFERDLFYKFLKRYDKIVGKMKATSVDDDRGNLFLETIKEYIKAIVIALKLVTDLRLVLNMDETFMFFFFFF